MKKLLIILIVAFGAGYLLHQPKVKIVEKEVKVYDFTQDQKTMEMYAHSMGKTLENKKDIDEYKRNSLREIEDSSHLIWRNGYNEGYRAGYSGR